VKLDDLNKWLTLIANLGVLVGIIFLSMEINQSNRIAERDGRSDLVAEQSALEDFIIENTEMSALLVKLSEGSVELTSLEELQLNSFVQKLILHMADLYISYETGFLAGGALQRQIYGFGRIIERVPGIAPYLAEEMRVQGIYQPDTNPVFDEVYKLVESVN
jgi:hypothetical protein